MKGECGCLGELKSCVLGVTENEDKKLHATVIGQKPSQLGPSEKGTV